jgi:hypothetical protein
VGVVASGSINIINSGGFTFTDIIKSNNGSIDIVSEFSVTDLNGTATSLSAENGTVTVKINSSGNFGATGNPIEIRAKGRSITVQSGSSIFDSFTDTTATESTTETTTTSTTTTTDTPPPPAPGSGPPPVGGERFTSDNVPQGFSNTPEAIAQLNKDNSTGVQAGFIEAIEGIVKGPGC